MSFIGRTFSVTGTQRARLSDVLTSLSFTGGFMGQRLTLAAPQDQTLYVGDSQVTDSGATKGFQIHAGETFTWSAGGPGVLVDPTQVYLYLASTGDVGVAFWSM